MKIQYGDILLVHGDNLISQTIQHLTNSYYSHAAICADPGQIAEMTRWGFEVHQNHYLSGSRPYIILRHRWLFTQNIRKLYYLNMMKYCIEKFRRTPPKYDFFEILNQAVKLILNREESLQKEWEDGIPVNVLMAVGERLICSALIDQVYESAGIDLFPGRVSKHTTPADIASLSSGNNPVLLAVYKSKEHP